MHKVMWDQESGGVLLTQEIPEQSTEVNPPRPVFYAEIHQDDDLKSVSKPIALQRYKTGKITLARAAEIACMDQESFKELLQEAGIARSIEPSGDTFGQKVEQLMRLRKPTS